MANFTVSQVVDNGLCTGCGTCVSLCPKSAVSLFIDKKSHVYLAKVNQAVCVNCGLCLKVCPGYTVDFAFLNKHFFDKDLPSDRLGKLLGNYLTCYVGHASDSRVRYDSSSGGLITQLLIFALEEGIIDGALVTRMQKGKPLEPEPFIARTRQEIIEASKSKYCPVPVNLGLKEILSKDGRYAVVGLPCHLHGVRKAELANKTLQERIVLHFGLVCTHNDNFDQTNYLIQKYNLKQSEICSIDFRGKGWPGILTFKLKSGKELNYPFQNWVSIHEQCFFAPLRCLTCCDQTAELSDVSFGDAWLPEFLDDKNGASIIISRTVIGDQFLSNAKAKLRIKISECNPLKMAKSQGMMRFKKNSYAVRVKFLQVSGKASPSYIKQNSSSSFIDYPRSMIIIVNQFLAKRHFLWWLFNPLLSFQGCLKTVYLKLISS